MYLEKSGRGGGQPDLYAAPGGGHVEEDVGPAAQPGEEAGDVAEDGQRLRGAEGELGALLRAAGHRARREVGAHAQIVVQHLKRW